MAGPTTITVCPACAAGNMCGCGCDLCVESFEMWRTSNGYTGVSLPVPGIPLDLHDGPVDEVDEEGLTEAQRKLGIRSTKYLPRGYDADVD